MWLEISWIYLSNATEFARFRVRMSELRPLVFGRRNARERKEEKQDSPRTIDFGCGFAKKLILQGMIVEPSDDLDATEVLDLYEELMMSLKASLRVKVIVAPHGQDV
uniref:Uncharacterized protein n=1 Tax=Solanum tuberosum TaxID=4113 RepID=M1DNM3_SOLTU